MTYNPAKSNDLRKAAKEKKDGIDPNWQDHIVLWVIREL